MAKGSRKSKTRRERLAELKAEENQALAARADLPSHIRMFASVPGVRNCLTCREPFLSPDKEHVRICLSCRQRSENPPREITLKSLGLSSFDVE